MCDGELLETEQKYGILQCQLPGMPFGTIIGRADTIISHYFLMRVFEELSPLGYLYAFSTNLSKNGLDQGTLIFRRNPADDHSPMAEKKTPPQMCCVVPYGSDKLLLIRCKETYSAVKEALIGQGRWPPGIKSEKTIESVCGSEVVVELKLRGSPWGHNERLDEFMNSSSLILEIIKQCALLKWRLFTTTSFKCEPSGDALYFVKADFCLQDELAMMTPARRDKLWLLDFHKSTHEEIKDSLKKFYQTKPIKEFVYGQDMVELKLEGYPFWTNEVDELSVNTRQMMCRILETLREDGWALKTGLNLAKYGSNGGKSMSNDIQSSMVFSKCESAKLKYACLAPTDIDRLWLINFPSDVSSAIADMIKEYYRPGIMSQDSIDAGSKTIICLNGTPWTTSSTYGLHATSMIMVLISELHKLGWQTLMSANFTSRTVKTESVNADYPVDVQSVYFCCKGSSRRPTAFGTRQRPISSQPKFSELNVSDLEDIHFPAVNLRPSRSASANPSLRVPT